MRTLQIWKDQKLKKKGGNCLKITTSSKRTNRIWPNKLNKATHFLSKQKERIIKCSQHFKEIMFIEIKEVVMDYLSCVGIEKRIEIEAYK